MTTSESYDNVASAEAVTVKTSSSKIPEAEGLTWTDSYFESTNGVIAVFDVDHDLAHQRIRYSQYMLMFFAVIYCVIVALPGIIENGEFETDDGLWFFYIYMIGIFGFVAYQVNKQLKGIRGIHLAVTEEGIHKVTNGFPFGSFFRTTTVMPFEDIESCVVNTTCRPSCCCKRDTVIVTAKVDSTKNMIPYIKDAEGFVELVNAMMKRGTEEDLESVGLKAPLL